MISRAQRILFAAMLLVTVVMAAILIRLRERALDRLQAVTDGAAPLVENAQTAPEQVTLYIPNDLDGSLTEQQTSLSLPSDESMRAQALLNALVDRFRAPRSTHPIDAPSGVSAVFLLPQNDPKSSAAGKLAVVDLSAAFAAAHPSGIEPETLTLLAMIATLSGNLRDVSEVRFLVDGRQQPTLAGHADLTRSYLASSATLKANG